MLLGLVLLVMVTAACYLDSAETAYNRGWDYAEQGDYENAIEEYDEAIRLDPQLAEAYNNRGAAYGSLGQYEREKKSGMSTRPGLGYTFWLLERTLDSNPVNLDSGSRGHVRFQSSRTFNESLPSPSISMSMVSPS